METFLLALCIIFAISEGWLLVVIESKKCVIKELQDTLKSEQSVNAAARENWKQLNYARNKQLYALQHNNSALLASKVRMSRIIRILRRREDPTSLRLAWLITPETDVNICKVRVREQLAIELENAGAIKYKTEYFDDPKLGGDHIGVTATINLLNLTEDGTERTIVAN